MGIQRMQAHQHGHTPVSDLRLAPPLEVTDSSVAGASVGQEAQGVKDVGEWLGDAWHRLLQGRYQRGQRFGR